MGMEISSIDADGWQTVVPAVSPGPLILADLPVLRAGYAPGGVPTSFSELLKLTQRIRLPYPNHATLTVDKVALSDFIYATDSVAGAVNNSALQSPKPIAKWATLDREVVGNALAVELVAFHRDGIAHVEFSASDGVSAVTAGTSAPEVLAASYDRFAVIGYKANLDISALNPGLIIVHARVYPRLGGAASVLDSADKADRRAFSARYYRKDVERAAAPPMAYVSATGSDLSGVVSTDWAAAAAAPCATVAGAMNRLNAVAGAIDGCVVRVMAGTHTLASPAATRTQNIAAVRVTRDPAAGKSEVVLQFGAANFNPRLSGSLDSRVNSGAIRFQDLTLRRVGGLAIAGDSGKRLEVQMSEVVFDNAGIGFDLFNASDFWWAGVELRNISSSATQATLDGAHMMWRGCWGNLSNAGIDGHFVIGCHFDNCGRVNNGSLRDGNGSIRAFNRFMFATNSGTFVSSDGTVDLTDGLVIAQNILEGLPNTSFTLLVPSADNAALNVSHLICLHNSITGHDAAGRSNLLYNDTAGDPRFHTLQRVAGNIHCQLNTKHDVFMQDGTRTGAWSYLYGVGCEGEFTQFRDAGTFAQAYPGIGSVIGGSNTVRNDPLFVDYRGATAAAAGLGGGDYRLQAGSPAIGVLTREYLSFDLQGAARTRRSAGALGPVQTPAAGVLPDDGVVWLEDNGSGLRAQVRASPAAGWLAVTGAGTRLGVAGEARAAGNRRVLRVDGEKRSLWAGRD